MFKRAKSLLYDHLNPVLKALFLRTAGVIWLALHSVPSIAAEITVAKVNSPLAGLTHHLHLEGPIEYGDVERTTRIVQNLPRGRDAFLVVSLNSPGGDVGEGLELAQLLQSLDMQVVTDVMTIDGQSGTCASACSYVFLGGTYRFLSNGSQIGVHQFRYVEDQLTPKSQTTRD